MKILGLIPARGGSKGIPKKNIKKLGGKELIRYTIEMSLKCSDINELIVSTDDENIAHISREAGANVPFLRPKELAADTSPTIDTIVHALQFFKEKNIHFDAVCLLQPTTPFRTSEDIQNAIQIFKKSKADSLISVREVPHVYNPHWIFEPQKNSDFLKLATGEETIISRRQDLPKAYHRDGSIYITKSEIILNQNSLYGQNIAYYLTKNDHDVNIDTMGDWRKAEAVLNKNSNVK
jgi:CMP-N-acetylneuraminic acid synthetase